MKNLAAAALTALLLVPAAGASNFATGDFGQLGHEKGLTSAAASAMNGLMASQFGLSADQEMHLIGSTMDAKGNVHYRFMQSINGLPVLGSDAMMHVDAEGNIWGLNGDFSPAKNVATAPVIDAARAFAGTKSLRGERTAPELVYVYHNGMTVLSWMSTVSYTNAEGAQKDDVFVNAITGEVVTRHPQHKYARSLATYSCNNTACGTLVSNSSNPINTGDLAADDAHNYAIATYDYFLANHGRDSIDDNGMTLVSRVHYGNNYNNAFWNGSQMTYGDGDGTTFIPLSRDADVVAHELTHGVTERISNLIYSYESGALNEAMSDIFGAMVDRQEGATGADIWFLGEDIYTPGTPGDALRDMAYPSSVGDYDYYPTRYTGSSDNGGVHWNSGIANLAFVLLVEGGTHPSGATSNNVPAIGFDKAAAIFYYANTSCLTQSSNFEAARNCTAQGATALYGATEEAAVQEAWDAVGVPGGSGGGGGGGGGGSDDCPAGYTTYTGTATAGGGDLVTNNFQDSGSFNGILICSGADLDLYLDRMRSNGNLRNTVASSTSAGCNEEINYSNNRNRIYRWRVSPYSGSASFTLCVNKG